jgi:hypothetical protein
LAREERALPREGYAQSPPRCWLVAKRLGDGSLVGVAGGCGANRLPVGIDVPVLEGRMR